MEYSQLADLTYTKVLALGTSWLKDSCMGDIIHRMIISVLSGLGAQVYFTVPYFEGQIPIKIQDDAKRYNIHPVGCKKWIGCHENPDKKWITKYLKQHFKESIWPNGKIGDVTHIIAYFPDTLQRGVELKEEYDQLGVKCYLIVIVCHLTSTGLKKEEIALLSKADKVFSVGPMNFRMCEPFLNNLFHSMLLPLHSLPEFQVNQGGTIHSDTILRLLSVWSPDFTEESQVISSLGYGLKILSEALVRVTNEYLFEKQKKVTWIIIGVPAVIMHKVRTILDEGGKCAELNVVLENNCEQFYDYLTCCSLYISPFLHEPFDMFCVQALLYAVPTLIFSTSGLGEYLGQRGNLLSTSIPLCLMDCESVPSSDVKHCFKYLEHKLSSEVKISQAFKVAKDIRNVLLSGTLLNATWEKFISSFFYISSQKCSSPVYEKVKCPLQGPKTHCDMDTGISGGMGDRHISGQTAQIRRSWKDVFDNKSLIKLSKYIGPKQWRLVGGLLDFSTADLDRFEADNYGHQNAVFAMLDRYKNGSPKYRTPDQIEELAAALEGADLINLACQVRGVEEVTLARQPAQQRNTGHPRQESMAPGQHNTPRQYQDPSAYEQSPQTDIRNLKVKAWEDESSYEKFSKDKDVYYMKSSPRGLAIIININEVKGFAAREGSRVDKELMCSLFEQLGFNIRTYDDLQAQEIQQVLTDIANPTTEEEQKYLQSLDCLTVVLMSHGQKEEIFGSDGRVKSCRALIDIFLEDRCPVFRNKPKLFFIQACRGGITDRGAVQHDGPGGCVREDGPNERMDLKIPQPETSNVLVAYSSVEGYKSYRHTTEGSWFVYHIRKVFSEYAKEMHILELLTKVTASVADKMPAKAPFNPKGYVIYKQCPEFTSTLRKKLYFFPGR